MRAYRPTFRLLPISAYISWRYHITIFQPDNIAPFTLCRLFCTPSTLYHLLYCYMYACLVLKQSIIVYCFWLFFWNPSHSLKSLWTALRLPKRLNSAGRGGWWGTCRLVGSGGEEVAGVTDFARGQKCALGVSVCAFVLFWSDNAWPSGFSCLCTVDSWRKPTHKQTRHIWEHKNSHCVDRK